MARTFEFHIIEVCVLLSVSMMAICVDSKDLASQVKTDTTGKYPLLVVSFDGFRWDYLQRTNTPNFNRFIQHGVTARYGLRNAFVTKTFPNHFTLATGLWEESHGIVANDMFDPALNQTFTPSNISANDDPAWFNVGAEPIWVTNQLQTLNGRSGVMMWVGGGAPIKWVTPSRYVPYNKNMRNETKIDMVIGWFMDKDPINLGMMYFDEPDGFGHTYGPNSVQMTEMIARLDSVVGYLLKKLEDAQLLDSMNIIITSDHGFTETPAEKMINLDHFIHPNSYNIWSLSPIADIWPHEGKLEEIYENLTMWATSLGNFDVYRREDVPPYFHYTRNRRISPILAVAHNTYSFCTGSCTRRQRGDHGYDNRLQDMHPFFLAMGPSFKKNVSVDTFDNVDVYPLMCHLLGLHPGPNNGSLQVTAQLLMEEHDDDDHTVTFATYVFVGTVLGFIAGVFSVVSCKKLYGKRNIKSGEYLRISESATEESMSVDTSKNKSLQHQKFSESKLTLQTQQEQHS